MTRTVIPIRKPAGLMGDYPKGIERDMAMISDIYDEFAGIQPLTPGEFSPHKQLFEDLDENSLMVSYDKEAGKRTVEGYAQYTLGPSYDYAHIESLYVAEANRKKGVGKAIVQTIVQDAARHGIHEVTLFAVPEAVGFYKKIGFDMADSELSDGTSVYMKIDTKTES